MARAEKQQTAAERASASRAERIAQGFAQKNFLLSPAAQRDLHRITKRDGVSAVEAVERALAAHANPHTGDVIPNARLAALVAERLG